MLIQVRHDTNTLRRNGVLDPVIKEHIKKQDAIEEIVRDGIDRAINSIDLDYFIDSPDEAFMQLAEAIGEDIIKNHAETAINNGIEIAETFESLKRDVVIPEGEPDMNKDDKEIQRGS
jgi:hypothetical protein